MPASPSMRGRRGFRAIGLDTSCTGSGSAAISSFAITGTGAGSFGSTGSAASSPFACSATAAEAFTGSGSAALSAFACSGSAAEAFAGSGSTALSSFACSATASVGIAGVGSAAMSPFAITGTGLLTASTFIFARRRTREDRDLSFLEDRKISRRRVQAASFSPAQRAVVGWFKAKAANVTLSGSDVTNWDDLAAGDNDAVTPGFGGNPLFIATDASIAGHSSIEFDQAGDSGNGEALDAVAVGPLVTGPFTVSCTARIDNRTVFCALWSLHDAVGGAYIYNGTENPSIIHVTSEDDAGATFASGAFTGIDGNWHVYTTVITPRVGAVAGSFAFYIDGVLKTMTDNTVESRLPFTYLKIGMSDGYALEGRIAEIAVYNEALDATTVRLDALFMASDKGITIP